MAEVRKTVTVVFADVSGSTELGERFDPEALRRVMERYFSEARGALERHGGTVEKFIGDAVVAVFGIPAAHEDDALRAVKAAAEIRERLSRLNEELEPELGVILAIRTGVNTGEVVAGDPSGGQFYATGDALNVAARLEQAAEPGEILLGEETYRLVGSAVRADALAPLHLKGKAGAVVAYRLVEVIEGAPAVSRRFDTPFVGRGQELARLLGCFERSVAERAPVLVTLLGPAGIGKTRLASELIANVGEEARVLQGRCLSYGESITFWPLQEILRSLPGRSPDVPDPEQAKSTEETFWAYRKLFAALALEQPLVLILEDVHWAEPTLLDLVEHIVEWTHDAPMMILCLARPELLDERPGWPGEQIELEPLLSEEAEALVGALAAGTDNGARTRAVIVAEGNPLFLEQILALAAEENGGEIAVPHTIQALLAARLDRLEVEERVLLERAAVIGKEFWRGALLHLSPSGTEVSALLQRLVRKRLILPQRSTFPGEDAFRFGHILVRDAAYGRLAKAARADLHGRFADWLEGSGSPQDEIVGYHLEQAYRYRAELGPVDEPGRRIGAKAAEFLISAGKRAFARGDDAGTANLLSRSASLLAADAASRLAILPDLGEALLHIGKFEQAEAVLDEAIERARAAGDPALEARATIQRLFLRGQTNPRGWPEDAARHAKRALSVFESAGDERGLASAYRLLAESRWVLAQYAAAASFDERSAEHARRAGDERLEAAADVTGADLYGSTPVHEGIRRCKKELARPRRNCLFEHYTLINLAALIAMEGRFVEARDLLARAYDYAADLGGLGAVVSTTERAFWVEWLAGDVVAAERELRKGYELLARIGEKAVLSTHAADLARVLCEQGRYDEAETFSIISEDAAAPHDLISQVGWRQARASILARRGRLKEAEQLAREAVSLARTTDSLNTQGDAIIDLAELLLLIDRREEAIKLLQESERLYEKKGNIVSAKRTHRRLEELEYPITADTK